MWVYMNNKKISGNKRIKFREDFLCIVVDRNIISTLGPINVEASHKLYYEKHVVNGA